ncbi:hypothetical protein [Chitinophaga filiformis]|uniref:Transposase n=1 Tax=Chitinophaga filiformis TaxID=104663 RepID=A0A1G7RXP7_CHIFI|nr:hypothetical protein [Chitinophaga filiformis]SDG15593.1 hypothetical protein SAMN04488121_103659 [Chitinophaga filiformis]
MDQNYRQLIEFLLPQGLLEYFDLIKTTQSPNGLHIYLEEKDELPSEYNDRKLHSKGARQLSLRLGEIFRLSKTRQEAFKKLALWHADVEE